MSIRRVLPLSALLLAGCAVSTTPHYDLRFGDAVRQARELHVINPQGVSNNAVLGIDGKAAREASVRYQNSFKEPPPVVNVINIGGAVGGK